MFLLSMLQMAFVIGLLVALVLFVIADLQDFMREEKERKEHESDS